MAKETKGQVPFQEPFFLHRCGRHYQSVIKARDSAFLNFMLMKLLETKRVKFTENYINTKEITPKVGCRVVRTFLTIPLFSIIFF